MKISNFDNSAVDEYIESLRQRETENTRSIKMANRKTDLLITVIKISIIPLVCSLSLLILFAGVSSLRSYEQIKRNFVTIEENSTIYETSNESPQSQNIVTASEYQVTNDEILDVDALIANLKNQSMADIEVTRINEENIITDYVIFNHQIIKTGNITKLTVGQKYSDINQTQPSTLWCYLTLQNTSGIRETVHLIKIDKGKRTDYEIGKTAYAKMGITKNKLKKIKLKCEI